MSAQGFKNAVRSAVLGFALTFGAAACDSTGTFRPEAACCPPDQTPSGCMNLGGKAIAGTCHQTCDFWGAINWRIEVVDGLSAMVDRALLGAIRMSPTYPFTLRAVLALASVAALVLAGVTGCDATATDPADVPNVAEPEIDGLSDSEPAVECCPISESFGSTMEMGGPKTRPTSCGTTHDFWCVEEVYVSTEDGCPIWIVHYKREPCTWPDVSGDPDTPDMAAFDSEAGPDPDSEVATDSESADAAPANADSDAGTDTP